MSQNPYDSPQHGQHGQYGQYGQLPQIEPRRYAQPHRGGMILAFGIVALVVCPIIFGPMAWVMGNNDMREIKAGRMDPEGRGLTEAGRILGIIASILAILQLGIFALIFCAGMAGSL